MRRIAVIDNDPSSCQLIADALGDTGTQIVCATTGRSGRRLLTSGPFDLVLIEVVLPDASGIALAEIAANKNTPVLLMTGRTSATKRLEDFDCPCLLKPIDLVRLHAETKKVMDESQQNVQRVKESRARYFASLAGFADAMADTTRLLEISRQLVDKAAKRSPRRGGPVWTRRRCRIETHLD